MSRWPRRVNLAGKLLALKAAFTLVELLVTLAILVVLVAAGIPAASQMSQYAARTKATSNMRQIGVAARLYANDHNQQLPGQPTGSDDAPDRWPALFCQYLSPNDPRVFLDNTDPAAAKLPMAEVVSNTANNTGYVYNGFDEMAVGGVPPATVPLTRVATPAQVVLLAQKLSSSKAFYVDPLLQPLAELLGTLNPQAYDGGAYYLYVDGSVRFTKQSDYSNTCWLLDKTISLPTLPLVLMRPMIAVLP